MEMSVKQMVLGYLALYINPFVVMYAVGILLNWQYYHIIEDRETMNSILKKLKIEVRSTTVFSVQNRTMIGGYFAGHPQIQPATLRPIVKDHPSTVHLPAEWKRKDEWYNFRDLQPDNVVLILLDESTYKGGKNGERHPIAWCKPVGKGRMFYTAGGHTKESFAEPEFIQHVNGGLLWTLGK